MAKNILNEPLTIKNLTLPNRVVMSPMCQYVIENNDGMPIDWHHVHYASRAIGGTGLILIESTGVEPDGRISDKDLGLWNDEQGKALKNLVDTVHSYGAKIGIQISHAGRKAENAVDPVCPSAAPIIIDGELEISPRELKTEEIDRIIESFASAAKRAVDAGFDTIEIHGAHGYLIHQFQSPSINQRTDEYGKDHSLFGCRVIEAVKKVVPKDMPLLMRLSAIEYIDGGYGLEHSLKMAEKYLAAGIDCFDISSGGEAAPGKNKPGNYPGYQLPFAKAFKDAFDVPVISVGMLDNPDVAQYALSSGQADLIAIGRGLLNDPYWAIHAMQQRKVEDIPIPEPYLRGIRQTPKK